MASPFSIVEDSATIGSTEYSLPADSTTLTTQTDSCWLSGYIDFSAMQAGDVYQVQMYKSVNGGPVTPVDAPWQVIGVQVSHWSIPAQMVSNGWNLTVKKMAGTDRAIGWALMRDTGDRNVVLWLGSAPNVLQSGRVDAFAGAMGAGVITATQATMLDENLSDILSEAAGAHSEATNAKVEAADARVRAADIQSRIPTALVGGRIDASVGAMAANVITAAAVAADAATEIATAVWAAVAQAGETFGDAIRLIADVLAAVGTFPSGDGSYTVRDRANSKDRLTGTRSGTARTITTRDGT